MAEVAVLTDRKAFFSTKSLAAYLEVSERTVRDWIKQGLIDSYCFGGARRIAADDVDTFVRQRRERGSR
jgi:excisionase family DNA binding protein